MDLTKRINAFEKLGKAFSDIASGIPVEPSISNEFNKTPEGRFIPYLIKAETENPWFSMEFLKLQFEALSGMLKKKFLEEWVSTYPSSVMEGKKALNIAVIMAGNIPLAGFHDLIAVLMAGHKLIARLSSKDRHLVPIVKTLLTEIEEEFENLIIIEEEQLSDFDAVIATGSGNSSRYFQYYFGKYPHIIRKNRNSAAILHGNESETDYRLMAMDIFSYFGLGCRNVTKVYLPSGMDVTGIIPSFDNYAHLINHHKYANNYTYHKAIKLINRELFLDNGFLLLSENPKLNSPVSCLHYEFYNSGDQLRKFLEFQKDHIQCVVSTKKITDNTVPPGRSQFPALRDYADGVDTMDFLTNLNKK